MNDDDPLSPSRYAGTLYIRDTSNGTIGRYNCTFNAFENLDDGNTWQFVITTTTPLKIVRTAKESH